MSKTQPRPLFDKILVGVDHLDHTEHAVHAGLRLAGTLGADLELVRAADSAEEGERARDELRSALKDRFAAATHDGRDLEDLLVVTEGDAEEVLLERARAVERSLIVLGPHEKRGLVDFGSTARSILSQSHRPVWIQVEEPREIGKILVPVDLAAVCEETLRHAIELAERFGAHVTLLNCFVGPEFAYASQSEYPDLSPAYVVDELRKNTARELEQLAGRLDWRGVAHETSFVEADPVRHVLGLQDEFDLIVLGSRGPNALATAILGSTAYGVMREAHRPVLAIHRRDD